MLFLFIKEIVVFPPLSLKYNYREFPQISVFNKKKGCFHEQKSVFMTEKIRAPVFLRWIRHHDQVRVDSIVLITYSLKYKKQNEALY